MSVYKLMGIVALSYSGIVLLLSWFLLYFRIKYKRIDKANYYIGKKLDIIKGKFTILYPMKIFSYMYIVSWLALVLPWIDVFIGTNLITSYQDGYLHSYFGIFDSIQSDSYFTTVLVTMMGGAYGFYVIKYIKNILCDESLFMGNNTRLGYRKRVF